MDIDDGAIQAIEDNPFVAGDHAQEARVEPSLESGRLSESPDGVVGDQEMEDMRSRALSIKDSLDADAVGRELADMVLRLTDAGIPLRTQVIEQASIIADLSRQREFILEREQEERGRWDAERESWSRTAEAVVAHANRPIPTIYKETAKPTPFLESDNAILRSKLTDAQQRLTALEAELSQLKPVLLMKPFTLAHTVPGVNRGGKKAKKDEGPIAGSSTSTGHLRSPEQTTPKADMAPRPYYRPTQQITFLSPIVHKPPKEHVEKKRGPTYADARSEHLLLAARRIGRERATLLSAPPLLGASPFKADELAPPPPPPPLFTTSPLGKGKGKADEHHHIHAMPGNPYTIHYPTTPKTPQKNSPMRLSAFGSPGAGIAYHGPAQPILLHSPPIPRMPGGQHPPFTYLPGPIPGPAYALYSPAYGYGPMPAPSGSPTRASARKDIPSPTARPLLPAPAAMPRASTSKSTATTSTASAQHPRTKRAAGKRKAQSPGPPVASSSKTTIFANGQGSKTPSISAFDLLSHAAQTVLSPAADLDPSTNAKRQKRFADQDDDDDDVQTSPTPTKKRARTFNGDDPRGNGSQGVTRASSALDVLADQAMFVGSQSTTAARSKVDTVYSHSRSASEHSFVGSDHENGMSSSSTGSHSLRPARWDAPSHTLGPSRSGNKNSTGSRSKSTRSSGVAIAATNGQPSSSRVRPKPRTRTRAAAQNHDHASAESNVESGAEEDERRKSASVEERSTTRALSTQRAQSSSQARGHEELRKEWLKKLGMFK